MATPMAGVIGFIGLGNMGFPMADNLLKAGYPLRVSNRSIQKAEPLIAQGARLVAHPAEAAEPGGIVMTMLSNDQALEEVTLGERGILERLGPDGIHVSMSTVSPVTARRLAAQHAQRGALYVAAPVFGRPEAAATRKLWICLAGPEQAKERARPLLNALGQGLFDFGAEPGAANVVKLAGNFLLASAIEALAEALTLAEKNGVDRAKLAAMLGQTLFACPAYQTYGSAIAQKRYQSPGFTLSLGLKDIDLVLQTAAGSTMPMPLASLLHDRFMTAVAKGRGDFDWAAIALNAAEEAGLTQTNTERRPAKGSRA